MTDIEELTRAYGVLTSFRPRYTFIKITDLADMVDITPERIETALLELAAAGRATLAPQSNQRALTDRQRYEAIRQGGENKHLVCLA